MNFPEHFDSLAILLSYILVMIAVMGIMSLIAFLAVFLKSIFSSDRRREATRRQAKYRR